jgi:anti-sigma factor RsiW
VDPLEEELVAYLDGELPEEEARLIEQRLANDPDLRRRALLLKKTYDLLDYLPQPVVSENFTTRTLEKIPAWRATATPANAPEAPAHPIVPSTSQPVLMTDTRSASS